MARKSKVVYRVIIEFDDLTDAGLIHDALDEACRFDKGIIGWDIEDITDESADEVIDQIARDDE